MNQIIHDLPDIEWFNKNKPLSNEGHILLKSLIPHNLPEQFIELLNISDGGDIDYCFTYYDEDFKSKVGSGIGSIYGISSRHNDNIIKNYYDPPAGFPKKLVAFGGTGGGDRICFDYREELLKDDPPIVYWNHEAPEQTSVSYIATDFADFLTKLQPPPEDD